MIHKEKPWDKNLQTLLAMVVAINILPHAWSAPIWASLVGIACVIWKVLYLNRGVALPKRSILGAGAILASIGTWFEYNTILGVDAASCLLVTLASLKLLETNRYRDAMLVIFTSYFLLMAHLLTSQSLLSTMFMACDILLVTSLMFHLHKRDRRRSARSFRPAMKMLALTLPVWVLFFFVFPRFTAAFWDVKSQKGGSGFSDELNPGAIEQLVENDEPAFRVTFQNLRIPTPASLYWRGDILGQSDGLRWSHRPQDDFVPTRLIEPAALPQTGYNIILEPGFQRWLFVLEYVKTFRPGDWLKKAGVRNNGSFGFRSNREFNSRVTYEAVSGTEAPIQTLFPDQKLSYLQLPATLSDRLQGLANRIQSEVKVKGAERTPALARAVLEYFEKEKFRYTLRPGSLKSSGGVAQLDEFLFESKVGFCEHYAAAFSTLMRMMKIPARIVVGFQGGRYNEFGNYLLVRHLDAHAWAEIWIDEPGESAAGSWRRMDPTQEIAPLRLQLGGDFNRLDPQQIASGLSSDELRGQIGGPLGRLLLRSQFAWDALQMKWNAFLLEYDLSYQLDLLTKLGFKNASALLLLAVLAAGLALFAGIVVLILRKRARRTDPVLEAWKKFCRLVEKTGVVRRSTEGPLAFIERAIERNPQAREAITKIGETYIDLRYAPLSHEDAAKKLSDLRLQVRRLSLPAALVDKASSSFDASS